MFAQKLVLHFSYHKCLTSYYHRVTNRLSRKFSFERRHFQSDVDAFNAEAIRKGADDYRLLSVNGKSDIPWSDVPDFRGSHFIRDPRDLIVSGYHYHLWTEEAWCKNDQFDWNWMTCHPYFRDFVESTEAKFPRKVSYQKYLNSLNKEQGMVLEMLWRQTQFKNMRNWDFENPNILELKYEDIVGNEVNCFRTLFQHYGFSAELQVAGLEICNELSLKNMDKSTGSHTRSGAAQQWVTEFTSSNKDVFLRLYGDLPVFLGYEHSNSWVESEY